MKTIVVIPAYNEAKAISQVVKKIKDKAYDVIVVNDGSADNTGELAKQAGAAVVNHFLNRGQGAALQTGLDFALSLQADIIVTFDADGQHEANEIDDLVEPLLLQKADVVLGSRFLSDKNQIPFWKKQVLKLATWFTRFYTGLPVTDVHNGFRALSRRAAELIEIRQDGMAHASEIIEQIKIHQLRFIEAPVTIRYTEYSLQKGQKLSNSFRIIWDLIIGRISK
ncbi:MAG: glycosyltransferase family 2 protein [Candidatus Buchananbacteria bacterium]